MPSGGDVYSIGNRHAETCNFNAANGSRTRDLLLAKRFRKAVNHGKESSNFN